MSDGHPNVLFVVSGEQEHEKYDHGEDPHEMVNPAGDPGSHRKLFGLFERLRAEEALHFD